MQVVRRICQIVNPVAGAAVVVLVFVQLYLIAEYVFGRAGALHTHETVGGFVPFVEGLVALTALLGWWRDRLQVGLSVSLLIIGVLQVNFAENIGHSPGVRAIHALLAIAVVLLAAQIALRKRAVVIRSGSNDVARRAEAESA